LALLVRTWNVFHGNADPPRRRGYLKQMVELASADRPSVLCLQELPVWALPLIDDWSGMRAVRSIARRPLVLPGGVAGWVTRRHQGLFRSGLAGQANAILVDSGLELVDLGDEQISERGRERRTCHAARVAGSLVVGNLHVSHDGSPEARWAEVERALGFLERLTALDEPLVLAGDFNHEDVRLPGFTDAGAGIDHVLVRGLPASAAVAWPRERRLQNGVVLSDHAPVEVTVG
jgi:endonuclease/exonuclease/phosphatase family metal-dependent hydrolase